MVTVTDADEGENAELSLFVEHDEEEGGEDGKEGKQEVFSIEIILEPFLLCIF